MSSSSQKRAVRNYRDRLAKQGVVRFEVLGLKSDRNLIRSLARRLTEDTAETGKLRAAVEQTLGDEPPGRGGILAALRRSPLVGVELDLARAVEPGRKVEL